MEPAPVRASPPETFQLTVASSPLASVAENCSTAAPLTLLALQPVQLVSSEAMPGLMENAELTGLALTTLPPAQPARIAMPGAAAKSASLPRKESPRRRPAGGGDRTSFGAG